MQFNVVTAAVGKWKTNAYSIVYGNEAVLIDPGEDYHYLKTQLTDQKAPFTAILNTHGHFDHVGAVEEFRTSDHLPFYLHSGDKRVLKQSNLMRKVAGIEGFIRIPQVDHWLDEISVIGFGGGEITVHHTPGHTMGSVSFEIGEALFSGDLILSDAVGRTDLPGGNRELLQKSLSYLFENFSGYTIYPGHGPSFVLDEELQHKLQI